MRRRADDSDFHCLLVAGLTGSEATVGGIAVMAFHGVAYVVGEHCYALHFRHIFLKGTASGVERRRPCRPTFAVDEYRRIYFLEFGRYAVHRSRVVYGHEVEAEAVDMVFLSPILHGIHYEIGHLPAFRRRLVAASAGIAVAAVGIVAVVIARSGEREIRAVVFGRVVVHHIHHHAYARIVERFHHFLHFTHAHRRVGRISAVRSFGSIVVLRVIAPIVAVGGQIGLIHAVVVVAGKNVHMRHTQFLEMVYARSLALRGACATLGQSQEFALVHDAACGMHAHVAVMHLIDYGICYVFHFRPAVLVPSVRISACKVDYSGTLAIGANGFRPYSGSFIKPSSRVLHAESVKLAVKPGRDGRPPCAAFGTQHGEGVFCGAVAVGRIQQHLCGFSLGRPQREMSAGGVDEQFEIRAFIGRKRRKARVGFGRHGNSGGHCAYTGCKKSVFHANRMYDIIK